MRYTGVIIEESLEDKSILALVNIVKTIVEEVTEKHKTPWIFKWTLHTVEIPEERMDEVAQKLSTSLDTKHPWFADFKNDQYSYIIFLHKVFKMDKTFPEQFADVKKYGISLGIPSYQLDFVPKEKIWER
jgi:hypothetical protein